MASPKGSLTRPYLIYTILPQRVVAPDVPLSQLQLDGCAIIVEENDTEDAPHPLNYLKNDDCDICIQVY